METTSRTIRVLFKVFIWFISLAAITRSRFPGANRGRDSSRPLITYSLSALCSARYLCDPVIGTDPGLVLMLGLQDLLAKESRSSQADHCQKNRGPS